MAPKLRSFVVSRPPASGEAYHGPEAEPEAMDGQPPIRRMPGWGMIVGAVVLIFLALMVFGMLSEREDARNIPPEERPAVEQVR